MRLIDEIKEKAKKNPQNIVLAEGEDERTIRASIIALNEGIAIPVMVGDKQKIMAIADPLGISLDGIEIIDPKSSPNIDRYSEIYMESRGDRRITKGMAEKLLRRTLYYSAMMVTAGDAKGMVAGCTSLTATVVVASQLMIGLREGISSPSSFFIMSVPDCPYGENGNFIYADAGVNPDPTPQELAEIAIASAQSAIDLGWQPRIAMLSFSTKGSANHKRVDKVIEATKIAKEMAPDLMIDGEFQLDSAIVPQVAERKVKEPSDVAGRANILIFPDLDAGNISYKITQYLAKAEAYGPLLQGFNKPVNDLSRGASVDDIVGVIAFTSVQAQKA
ncbi:TPA: phosphate acetyltransferase [bacterium]|nr:phosphate acetyltransferase [bacterium]